MRKIAALATLFSLVSFWSATAAAAGLPCPYMNYGYVPTPSQWQQCWTSKADAAGQPFLSLSGGTMQGSLGTVASSSGGAGFNIPPGVAPTSPVNGDIWTTLSGIFVRINGATVGPLAASTSSSFTATSPLVVTFPAGTSVNYEFDLTVANTFLAQQTGQGATTTQPGWYAQIAGDSVPRMHVGASATDVATLSFGSGSGARDAFLQRAGAANLRYGGADAASPVAQTFSVQNVVTGTSNTAGAALTIAGSRGTGTGIGGSLLFQIAPAGGSGTAQNALSTALTIFGTGGISTGAATDQGAGTLNLVGNLFNNGTPPTGTGGYVRATSPSLVTPSLGVATGTSLALGGATIGANALAVTGSTALAATTVTTSFTATGLVTNADLATMTANTFLANVTGGIASPTAASLPSCTGSAAALQYTSGSGLSCGTISATAASITYGTTTAGTSVGIPYNATNGGTLTALAITSGGILYGSSSTVPAFSAALTANGIVYGGGAGVAPAATAAGTNGQLLVGRTGTTPTFATGAVITAMPGNPTGTSSATGVMMGVGSSCTITPVWSTHVAMTIEGFVANGASNIATTTLRFGTSTAPTNGAAPTGTALTSSLGGQPPTNTASVGFSITGLATGLTPGTAYWFDFVLASPTSGTSSSANITCTAHEVS